MNKHVPHESTQWPIRRPYLGHIYSGGHQHDARSIRSPELDIVKRRKHLFQSFLYFNNLLATNIISIDNTSSIILTPILTWIDFTLISSERQRTSQNQWHIPKQPIDFSNTYEHIDELSLSSTIKSPLLKQLDLFWLISLQIQLWLWIWYITEYFLSSQNGSKNKFLEHWFRINDEIIRSHGTSIK